MRPLPAATALRLTFDDGHIEDITDVALIGRNPAGYDGEMISRLLCVQDSSRSVSKTHLHVRVGGEGLWVTDRNSTNGSAITILGGASCSAGRRDSGAGRHWCPRSFRRPIICGGAAVTAVEGRPAQGASGVRLSFGFGTDRGLRRELNEDSFLAADPLFAVADGMGGHEAGEVASRECIQTLSEQGVLTRRSRQATASDLAHALRLADARIRELTNARAGTTVSAA